MNAPTTPRHWTWSNPFRRTVCECCGAKQPRRPFSKPSAWCWKCEELLDPQQVLLGDAGTLVLEWRALAKHPEPITKLIGLAVLFGLSEGAEELRFEPTGDELRLWCVVDQAAYEMVPPPFELRKPIGQVLKAISNIHPRASGPQAGHIAIALEREDNVMQTATIKFAPSEFGEMAMIQFPGPCRYDPKFKKQLQAAVEALVNRDLFDVDLNVTTP